MTRSATPRLLGAARGLALHTALVSQALQDFHDKQTSSRAG